MVFVKSGRASLSDKTLGVFINMNAIVGRRRTIWEEG